MNSVLLHSSLIPSLTCKFHPLQLQSLHICKEHDSRHSHQLSVFSTSFRTISYPSFHACKSSIGATIPSNEGSIPVINFEDFIEKDWSFLDPKNNLEEEHNQKINRIVSAGQVEENSKVMVSIASEEFIDRLVDLAPSHSLLVVHDSLLALACIKEKYDKVKCWQGELIYVPEKWVPFDVVFLYFLPALPFELDLIFGALSERCLPGARLVISHPQGGEVLEQQRKQYPDVLVSDLPDKMSLEKVAADHSFMLSEFVDEPGFYLAILKFRVTEI